MKGACALIIAAAIPGLLGISVAATGAAIPASNAAGSAVRKREPEVRSTPAKVDREAKVTELTGQLGAALKADDYKKANDLINKLTERGQLPKETMKVALTAAAIGRIRQAAEGGDPLAQRIMASLCQMGEGVPQDAVAAFNWYKRAAAQGNAEAEADLATCYSLGMGVRMDQAESLRWFRKAADQGLVSAQCRLGHVYENGQGVPKDLRKAAQWYRKAADQGYAPAEFELAEDYVLGQGVPRNYAEGAKWFRKAAEQGHADAQFALGLLYMTGRGVKKAEAEGIKWWRKAAEQGQLDAQMGLGVAYTNGWWHLPKKPALALKWLSKAGEGYWIEGDEERASECYDRMAGIDPQSPLTRKLYAKLHPKPQAGPRVRSRQGR